MGVQVLTRMFFAAALDPVLTRHLLFLLYAAVLQALLSELGGRRCDLTHACQAGGFVCSVVVVILVVSVCDAL